MDNCFISKRLFCILRSEHHRRSCTAHHFI